MPVYNGQDVSAEITNPAFLDAQEDDTAAGKISFHNTDPASGGDIDNIQRNINEICSVLGISPNEVYNYLITWASAYIGATNSTVKDKVEALVSRFLGIGGHVHTGIDGESSKISAYDLINTNFYFAEWQPLSLTGVSGSTWNITSLMTLENPNGSSTNLGVLTFAPLNRVWILNPSDETFFESSTGQRVYGRITYLASVWTLSFYTNLAGVETPYTFSTSNLNIYFLKIFDQKSRPTIPEYPGVFGTMDLTADIMDASPTQRGLVNLLTQTFSGNKTFQGITTVSNTTESTVSTDGALIVSGGLGVAKNINIGGNAVITGDLTVNGTTTTLNTQTLDVEDKNITVNLNGNDASSEGAGLTIDRTSTKGSLIYASAATSKFKCGSLGSEKEIATISDIQNLTNKTLDNTNTVTLKDANFTLQDDGDITRQAQFDAGLITAGQTRTYALPDANCTLLGETNSASVSNKTLDNTNSLTIKDANLTVQDNADVTKQFKFEATNITAGQTRIYSMPDRNGTIALYADAIANFTESIAGGSAFSVPTAIISNYLISSTGGEVNASSTPFGAIAPIDNFEVLLCGASDTDVVTIVHNDAAKGCLLNGNCRLPRGSTLKLKYMSGLDRFVEVSRSQFGLT